MVEVIPQRQIIRVSALRYLLLLFLLALIALLTIWYYVFKSPIKGEFRYSKPSLNLSALASNSSLITTKLSNLGTSTVNIKVVDTASGTKAALNFASALRIHRIIQNINDKTKYYILFSLVDDRCNVIKNVNKADLQIKVKDDVNAKYIDTDILSINPLISFKDWQNRAVFSCILDWSGSMEAYDLQAQREYFGLLFDHLKVTFKTAVFKFSSSVYKLLDLSDNIEKIKKAINEEIPVDATALYDAIYLGMVPVIKAPYFRFGIITTDGIDNSSKSSINNVTSLAYKNEVSLIVLGFGYASIEDLVRLSESTEGYFIYVEESKNLQEWFIKIADLINHIQVAEIKIPNNLKHDIHGVSMIYTSKYLTIERAREKVY